MPSGPKIIYHQQKNLNVLAAINSAAFTCAFLTIHSHTCVSQTTQNLLVKPSLFIYIVYSGISLKYYLILLFKIKIVLSDRMVDSGESTEVVGVKAGIENSTKLVIEKAPTKEKTAKNSESEEDEDEVIPKKVDRAKKPPVRRDTSPRESDSDELSEEEVVPKKTARKQLKSAAIIRRSDDESESEPSASDGSDSDFDFKKASGKKIAAKPKRKAPPTKKASPAKKATPKGIKNIMLLLYLFIS